MFPPTYDPCEPSPEAVECCGFAAYTAELWNQYAAAMECQSRHNALREAVEWEREFDEVLVWLVQTGRYPRDMAGKYDLANDRECARAEVDRLLGEPTP